VGVSSPLNFSVLYEVGRFRQIPTAMFGRVVVAMTTTSGAMAAAAASADHYNLTLDYARATGSRRRSAIDDLTRDPACRHVALHRNRKLRARMLG